VLRAAAAVRVGSIATSTGEPQGWVKVCDIWSQALGGYLRKRTPPKTRTRQLLHSPAAPAFLNLPQIP
jgi:hypothetical protein